MALNFQLPDSRDWIGIGTFSLTVFILALIWKVPDLRNSEFFKSIAVLIIGTGWVNGAVAWAYSATKTGGELANRAAAQAMGKGGQTITGDNPTVQQTVKKDDDETETKKET
jgi:hypothetical protein